MYGELYLELGIRITQTVELSILLVNVSKPECLGNLKILCNSVKV